MGHQELYQPRGRIERTNLQIFLRPLLVLAILRQGNAAPFSSASRLNLAVSSCLRDVPSGNECCMARRGVYVLEHNSGCFYVGSSNDIDNRVAQHRNNPVLNNRHGGIFRVHQPMTPHNPNLRSWERDETLARMMEHGIDRVRGWEFQGDILSLNHLHTIKTLFFGDFDLCRRCGFRGHYQTQCTTDLRHKAAWLREIERLQIEQQGQNNDPNGCNIDSEELVSNMANIYISSTTPARHGLLWSADEENELREEVQEGLTDAEIASNHERSLGAIQQRVNILGLRQGYGLYNTF